MTDHNAPTNPPHAANDPHSAYTSPLTTRNASPQMQAIWSPRRKFEAWRRLWLALAEAQSELGLPITPAQLEQMRGVLALTDDDFANAARYEKALRHDVMAHVRAFGDAAPEAAGVIHLGATSQFINCNAETLLLRDALRLVCVKLARTIDALARFAEKHKEAPCLGFTHYQPAQPTTVGRRAAQWGYDLALCLSRVEATLEGLRLRGAKGATGTQASFLDLFEGDAQKVEALDRLVCEKIAGPGAAAHTITGQTYPRVVDAFVLSDLACAAAAVHKIAGDIRLLASRKELDEPFSAEQVGSSAMPYKRNPMRCERAAGLARFVISLAHNAYDTAATQWLERTLDDSANRRLSLPESFLALDGALDLLHGVAEGLDAHESAARLNLMEEMPFLASENLMMRAVKLGRNRQDVHEAIREHAQRAAYAVKKGGKPNDLLERLRGEPLLAGVDLDGSMDPAAYVGLAPRQVERFVEEVADPIRARYADDLAPAREPSV